MSISRRALVNSLLGAMVATSGWAQSGGDEKEFRPPFWPAWYHPEKAPVPTTPSRIDQMEFRGVLSVAGETFITLVDSASSRAWMIPLNASSEGITVSDFHVDNGTVRARNDADGRERLLALHEARIVALAPPPVRSTRPKIHVHRTAPRDENRDRVAQEIQRRREMRRQLLDAGISATMTSPPAPTADSNP